MIPLEKVEQIISRYETLEQELASGNIKKKDFAQKSKEYSSIREIINQVRSYLVFEKEKTELEKIIEDEKSDNDIIELAKNELIQLTKGKDKVYAFALAQAELANKNTSGAIEAFQLAHKAAPEWFAAKEALEMLGAPLNAKK